MPERADAIHEVAQAVERVGDSVGQLTGELRAARDKTHRELNHLRRLTWLVLFGLIGLTLLAVVSTYTLYLVVDTISPGGARFRQGQERTGQAVAAIVVDNDCRNRRAAAGLPAPDPRTSCPAQTPNEVFPGVGATTPTP